MNKISHNVWKRTFEKVSSTQIQISLRIRTVCSESSLGALWVASGLRFLHADNEDYADALSLYWAYMSEGMLSRVVAQIWLLLNIVAIKNCQLQLAVSKLFISFLSECNITHCMAH